MLDHYYDKLVQISRPPSKIVQNKYLENEAQQLVEPLLNILLKYGKSGEVPFDDIAAIMARITD